MRWWLNTDHKQFSVENAAVKGMDFSALSSSLWMVQWIDGKGELEYQTADGENLNGLREPFTDMVPYVSYFQQFLTLLPGLTLPQAKKVQCDLLGELFVSKRQMPIAYLSQNWDCSDDQVNGMTQKATSVMSSLFSGTTSSGNDALASMATAINTAVNAALATVAGQIKGAADYAGGVSLNAVNATVTGGFNNRCDVLRNDVNTNVTAKVYAHFNEIRNMFISVSGTPNHPPAPWDYTYWDSYVLFSTYPTGPTEDNDVGSMSFTPHPAITPATINISGGGMVPPTVTIPLIPIGSTTPINLTFAQFSTLLQQIADRRATLNQTALTKKAAVNALTTIPAVIAYDVKAGW